MSHPNIFFRTSPSPATTSKPLEALKTQGSSVFHILEIEQENCRISTKYQLFSGFYAFLHISFGLWVLWKSLKRSSAKGFGHFGGDRVLKPGSQTHSSLLIHGETW